MNKIPINLEDDELRRDSLSLPRLTASLAPIVAEYQKEKKRERERKRKKNERKRGERGGGKKEGKLARGLGTMKRLDLF